MFGGCTEPFECNCSLGKNATMQNKYKGAHCDIRKLLLIDRDSYSRSVSNFYR